MKNIFVLVLLFLYSTIYAGEGYRSYLTTHTVNKHSTKPVSNQIFTSPVKSMIPAYQIPKGNVFCRMEDKLIRVTKVWIKIGVK